MRRDLVAWLRSERLLRAPRARVGRRGKGSVSPEIMIGRRHAEALGQGFGQMGRAKSHAERLSELVSLGPLDGDAAAAAICVPIGREEATTAADVAMARAAALAELDASFPRVRFDRLTPANTG